MGLGGDRVRVGLQVDSIRGDPVTAGPPVTCDAAAPGSGRSLGQAQTHQVGSGATGSSACPSGRSLAHSWVPQARALE